MRMRLRVRVVVVVMMLLQRLWVCDHGVKARGIGNGEIANYSCHIIVELRVDV